MRDLKIYLFGPPRVEVDKTPVDIERRKALALLAYLAVSSQPHSRDALATLFWPDLDQQRARAYFRRDLAALNTSLPGSWLTADRETVELNREATLWVDTEQFQRLLAARVTATRRKVSVPTLVGPGGTGKTRLALAAAAPLLDAFPQRHRSARAIFEQTWGRLLSEERAVLSQLSIFRGGCLRPAAEAVTGATFLR